MKSAWARPSRPESSSLRNGRSAGDAFSFIVPATLRKQWQQGAGSKFYLLAAVLDSKAYREEDVEGGRNPLTRRTVSSSALSLRREQSAGLGPGSWDLVVLDEAHRLRNVFQKSSKIARRIVDAIGCRPRFS